MMDKTAVRASVIVRSKDEAARLRLTLASLAAQSAPAEVVVVNDGSRDHTPRVLDEALERLPIIRVNHVRPLGRSEAANAGVRAASGDIVIFLDGDTLAGPDFVARHLATHRANPNAVARGETHHLRQTRFLADPETGSPMPGEEARVAAMTSLETARAIVTIDEVLHDFATIDRRAQPGIYPGAAPRRLYELEMETLRAHPRCTALWIAASGSNQSVARHHFLASGGFHPSLTINEHRELALRLCRAGLTMTPADGARSYHMTHRRGWRDPLEDTDWEAIFYEAHPVPEVALLAVLWGGLAETPAIPLGARLDSIVAFAEIAPRYAGLGSAEAVRSAHFAACGRPPGAEGPA